MLPTSSPASHCNFVLRRSAFQQNHETKPRLDRAQIDSMMNSGELIHECIDDIWILASKVFTVALEGMTVAWTRRDEKDSGRKSMDTCIDEISIGILMPK